MSEGADVVIVGAGVMGASIACHLAVKRAGRTSNDVFRPNWSPDGRAERPLLPALPEAASSERLETAERRIAANG